MLTTRTKGADIRRSSSRRSRSPKAGHPAAGGWRRLGVVAAVLGLCLAGHGAAAQDRETGCEGVACLARAVIDTIPEGERIALIPFWWPVTNLPEKQADALYVDLYEAMYNASDKRHDLVTRARVYDEIWEAAKWELADSNFQKYVDRLRATVVVLCKDGGLSGGMIKLSCTATGVDKESALGSDMPPSQALIPIPGERQLFPYEYALTQLSNTLAAGARDRGSGPQEIPVVFIIDADIGQRSELTEDIGKRIVEGIWTQFERFHHEKKSGDSVRRAIGRQPDDATETPRGYALSGAFKWTDEKSEEASLRVELREGDRLVAWGRIDLKRGWLPHTSAGARRYGAEARALPSDSLHKDIASKAAMNLARARVVAKAVGVEAPAFEVVTSEAEGIAALKTLAHGIPVGEQFNKRRGATGEQHVWLKARVVTVGGHVKPDVQASLTNNDLKERETFQIMLSASATVHVGVFAWGADGTVVRFYPNDKIRNLTVPAGARISLPRGSRTDGYESFRSEPLPNHSENHEAIIVVASIKPLDFQKLGSIAGEKLAATMSVAIPAGIFLESLGQFDLSQASLLVLPYRVRK